MLWKDFERRHNTYEKIMFDIARRHFQRNETDVISWLNQFGPRIAGNVAGWNRKKIEQWIATKDRFVEINIDSSEDAARWKAELSGPMRAMMAETGQYRASQLIREGIANSIVTFNVNDPKAVKWLGSRLETFSKEVSGTTFDEITAVLREGFIEGQPITKITETLRGKFDSIEQYRAMNIARTESTAAMNKADILAVEQEGLGDVLLKKWLIADGEARNTHIQAYDRYQGGVPLEEDFIVGTDSMQAPGCGNQAKEVCNCRCSIGYVEKRAGK